MPKRDIIDLITRTLELKRKDREHAEVLQEIYEVIDGYNEFVKDMDKKFDRVVSKMENLIEDDGHT